jgi:hypothetical protein
MALPKEIAALIETFAANEADYTAPEFKEAQVRQQFIDPFFAALGWDVANTSGYAEAYKEVMHEDALKIGGETKAPDYSFRIGGNRKFFVEAKKPSVLIKDHPEPAYQLRRYSWSAKLPLGILTDFQEFAIYDGRVKPAVSDKASVARLFYCRYDELEKHWDFIAGTFSKEAVLKGSFDKYAASTKGKRGTTTVDDAFLEEIEKWRTLLARNLALRNPALDTRGLNFAVQRTIDRIVFLRIAEDRGNEPFGQLQSLLGAVSANEEPTGGGTLEEEPAGYGGGKPKRPPTIYPRLVQIFEKADYRYNSGLFHFAKDADCAETPDTLTPGLHIDDAVFKEILGSLYYPKSPYVFTVLPAYILGHVYEQFLGKVIRLTDGHRAEIEEKPEVRKAGGVYYTPQYIVDYIVQKTVGPLVEGKTPKQLETLAVLDPACGSGTFLLGAYDYLLKWYLDYYSNHDAEDWAKGPSVAFKLPSKKQSTKILKQGPVAAGDVKIKKFARIYEIAPNTGKDAFGQPKVTTGNAASAKPVKSWSLTTEERKRILLTHIHGVDIDSQAVEVTKLSLLLKVLEGERREFQGSTVDLAAVLPDLSQNIRCGNSLIGHDFYQQPDLPTLDAEAKYKLNTFEWKDGFPEVMKRGGFDAVIGNPPYVLLQDENRNDAQLKYLRAGYSVASFKLDTYHLFIEQGVRILRAKGLLGYITPSNFLTNNHLSPLRKFLIEKSQPVEITVLNGSVFIGASVDTAISILSKTRSLAVSFPLKTAEAKGALEFLRSAQIDPQVVMKDENFLLTGESSVAATSLWKKCEVAGVPLGQIAHVNFGKQLRDRSKFTTDVIEVNTLEKVPKTHRACFTGKDVMRYRLNWSGLACLDDTVAQSGGCWDAERHQAKNKLLTRQIGKVPAFALDSQGFDCLNTVFMIGIKVTDVSPFYLLGVLNSRLIAFLWSEKFYDKRGTFPKIKGSYLKLLPIVKATSAGQKKVADAVQALISLHRVQAVAQTPHEKDALAKQITATDRQIDALVYQLYALTPEEISLIENQ